MEFKALVFEKSVKDAMIIDRLFQKNNIDITINYHSLHCIPCIDFSSFDLIIIDSHDENQFIKKLVITIRKQCYKCIVLVVMEECHDGLLHTLYDAGIDYHIIKSSDYQLLMKQTIAIKKRAQYLNYHKQIGDIQLNILERKLVNQDIEVSLNPLEIKFLLFLYKNINKIVTYEKIKKLLFSNGGTKNYKTFSNNFKRKISKLNSRNIAFNNVYAKGYILSWDNI